MHPSGLGARRTDGINCGLRQISKPHILRPTRQDGCHHWTTSAVNKTKLGNTFMNTETVQVRVIVSHSSPGHVSSPHCELPIPIFRQRRQQLYDQMGSNVRMREPCVLLIQKTKWTPNNLSCREAYGLVTAAFPTFGSGTEPRDRISYRPRRTDSAPR